MIVRASSPSFLKSTHGLGEGCGKKEATRCHNRLRYFLSIYALRLQLPSVCAIVPRILFYVCRVAKKTTWTKDGGGRSFPIVRSPCKAEIVSSKSSRAYVVTSLQQQQTTLRDFFVSVHGAIAVVKDFTDRLLRPLLWALLDAVLVLVVTREGLRLSTIPGLKLYQESQS